MAEFDVDAFLSRFRRRAEAVRERGIVIVDRCQIVSLLTRREQDGDCVCGAIAIEKDADDPDRAEPVIFNALNIILATGARARELPGLEADGDLVWNYKHALNPPRMPKKLLVIGSGAIGIEFASFFNSM